MVAGRNAHRFPARYARPVQPGAYAQIWTVRPNGASPKNLSRRSTAGDWNPSWSPDSRQIVFTSYRKRSSGAAASIWAFSRTGGKPHAVITAGLHEGYEQPAWSPNGAQMAWAYGSHFGDDVFAGPLGGDGHAEATWGVIDSNHDEHSQPDWQPLH